MYYDKRIMTNEAIIALISLIGVVIGAILTYRQHQNEQKTEKLKIESDRLKLEAERIQSERNQHLDFTKTLMERVDKLEERQDAILDDTRAQVKEIAEQYEIQLDKLKKEMEKLRFDSTMEVSVWRDRYFSLMEEYQQLKVKHNDLVIETASTMAKLAALEIEHNRLIMMHNKKIETTSGV